MHAKLLRHKIKILTPKTTRTATGAVKTGVWEQFLTLSARVTPLSVKEIMASGAVQNTATARCMIRYRTDISPAMRVQYAGQAYEIVGEPLADNVSGKEYLTLMLKRVVQ